jgi:hypothetical protein
VIQHSCSSALECVLTAHCAAPARGSLVECKPQAAVCRNAAQLQPTYQQTDTAQAAWVAFQPSPATADAGSWRMMKLGQPVSPTDVLRNGSQAMHAVDDDGVLVAGAGAHAWERLQIRRGAGTPPGRLCLRGSGHAQDACTPRGIAAQT